MEKNMTLGEKLKQIRTKYKLPQTKMAEIIEIETTYLSKLENNRLPHYLSTRKLTNFIEHFNLDTEEERQIFKLANKIPIWLKELVMRKEIYHYLVGLKMEEVKSK